MVVRPKISQPLQEQDITAARLDHLPIVAQYLRRLRLVEIVNALVPVSMAVEPGIIVPGAVLDTLSGRSPLYHLESAFEDYDREILFGRDIPPGYFNDDNVGRVFDALFAVGTQKLFSALSVSALQCFSLPTRHVHFDTTSVNVFGDYRDTDDDASFKITYGYSKDKRPDLKQFVLSLLCVGGNVPIVGKIEDGNASDKKINHRVLSDVSQHMARHGVANEAFIYVADSAMVTEENLAQVTGPCGGPAILIMTHYLGEDSAYPPPFVFYWVTIRAIFSSFRLLSLLASGIGHWRTVGRA